MIENARFEILYAYSVMNYFKKIKYIPAMIRVNPGIFLIHLVTLQTFYFSLRPAVVSGMHNASVTRNEKLTKIFRNVVV